MKKYLLIGSAPYIREWYERNAIFLIKRGFRLVAMNNAWAVDPNNLKIWIHSNDFHVTGKLYPTDEQERSWINAITDNNYPEKPYAYDFNGGSGTTILNALVYLLNITVGNGEKCIVAVAGSDCIYDGDKTHFYGEGTSDPLRYGEEWLVKELRRVGRFYKKEGCVIYNVGKQTRTLLPYARKTPGEIV